MLQVLVILQYNTRKICDQYMNQNCNWQYINHKKKHISMWILSLSNSLLVILENHIQTKRKKLLQIKTKYI